MKINAFLTVLLLVSSTHLLAQNSPRISVQGTLRKGTGVTVPDGNQDITFKLFPSATGGTAVWEEQATVEVVGGVYAHMLGSVTPLDPASFSQTLYVGIVINGKELLPRSELSYSPYTMFVQYAATAGALTSTAGFVPPGAVMAFAGYNPPDGWLKCNGQALSSSQYPELYNAIGGNYGNGSSGINAGPDKNFNVPDYRGEFLRGWDDGRGIDPGRYLETPQAQSTSLPNNAFTGATGSAGAHTHSTVVHGNIFAANHENEQAVAAGFFSPTGTASTSTSSAGAHTHTVSITGGGDAETRPRNRVVQYIIKY